MAISLRLSEEDERLIRNYATLKSQTVSDVVREAVLEKIEDEIDLAAYEDAMAEHMASPQTRTLDEVMEMLREDVPRSV